MIKCTRVVKLSDEHDVDTLRQISLLLDRENQRLIAKNLQLTAELARLRGIPDVEQLTFTVQHDLHQARTQIFQRSVGTPAPSARARVARSRATARVSNRRCRSWRFGMSFPRISGSAPRVAAS